MARLKPVKANLGACCKIHALQGQSQVSKKPHLSALRRGEKDFRFQDSNASQWHPRDLGYYNLSKLKRRCWVTSKSTGTATSLLQSLTVVALIRAANLLYTVRCLAKPLLAGIGNQVSSSLSSASSFLLPSMDFGDAANVSRRAAKPLDRRATVTPPPVERRGAVARRRSWRG
ncbi:uncharacterized protein BDW70DRAFT_107465 [Aspergillus foveolatus]|uniref:uncharacterized protein n=1 Tax=Aspergillus foveolatus TaxID=210207 RepID=UPI003CCDDEDF